MVPAAYLNSPSLGYTVFAPTNAAFENAFSMLDTNLTDILYSGHLDALLQYHFLLKPYTVRLSTMLVLAMRMPHISMATLWQPGLPALTVWAPHRLPS